MSAIIYRKKYYPTSYSERVHIDGTPLLVNLGQQANFVPEGGQSLVTGQQEAIKKLAQQIVGQMELAW